jgi:hypothetical protein
VESAVVQKRPVRTQDVKCLECGSFNLPENVVCGACGASLPVIFDREGRVFRFETDSPYWNVYRKREEKGSGPSPMASIGFKVVGLLALFTVLAVMFNRLGFSAPILFIAVLLGLIIAVRLFVPPKG